VQEVDDGLPVGLIVQRPATICLLEQYNQMKVIYMNFF
jgi:hypothetical protein